MCKRVEKQEGTGGWWNNGTMEKQEEEASVAFFSSRGRKDMYLSRKEIKMESEKEKIQCPALFSWVLQMLLGNLSKSATYRYHRYLKFPFHYLSSFKNYHATSLFGLAYIRFPSFK